MYKTGTLSKYTDKLVYMNTLRGIELTDADITAFREYIWANASVKQLNTFDANGNQLRSREAIGWYRRWIDSRDTERQMR